MESNKRSMFAGVVGHALEYYDIMLYGFFAAIIAPLFFPTDDPVASRLFSLASFAMGFVMRPVGSIVFGHLGDRLGRRKALMLSIFLVTLPTFIIGILPTYSQIGVFAPIILILCRLFQGFCLGGEVGGAITFVLEHAPKGRAGFVGSLLEVSCYVGGLIGTSIGFLCTLTFMPSWGWRLPFILGAIFGLIGFYIRSRIEETSVFIEAKKEKKLIRVPIASLLKNQKANLCAAIGICMGFIVPFYIITTYTNEILKGDLHLSTSTIMAIDSGLMVLWAALLPFMGKLADRIGIRLLMGTASIALILLAYPLFYFAMGSMILWKIITMQVVLSLCGIAFSAPFDAVFAFLFPPQERYSGSGLAYALGAALFGGMAPLMSMSLVHWTDNQVSPAYLLILSGVVGLISVIYSKKIELYLAPPILFSKINAPITKVS